MLESSITTDKQATSAETKRGNYQTDCYGPFHVSSLSSYRDTNADTGFAAGTEAIHWSRRVINLLHDS